ncbi:hypothetical protein EYF80_014821 [Liparis tanakae]|uniref:Uncharacterized protein n=1 Tax=Liparis tanakae TaxID=230148 RepID=A0A4Z2ICT9_9TELE|nr:hypothetical protein EYF80_014821 [Liparis tanakae]
MTALSQRGGAKRAAETEEVVLSQRKACPRSTESIVNLMVEFDQTVTGAVFTQASDSVHR